MGLSKFDALKFDELPLVLVFVGLVMTRVKKHEHVVNHYRDQICFFRLPVVQDFNKEASQDDVTGLWFIALLIH